MDRLELLQWIIFGLNILFILLIIKNKAFGWLFGIIAAGLSIYVFYVSHFVSEAYLNAYYVVMGIYGWVFWSKKNAENQSKPIVEYPWVKHLVLISGATGFALLMGKMNSINSYAAVPYADAFSTSFAFMATFLEARKVLSSWVYWIIVNLYSIWLYGQKDMDGSDLKVLQIQMAVFALFSILGFISWKKNWDGKITSMKE